MKSKGITRCMILALLMVFMTAGAAFAGVGGSNVPTVTSPVIVGDTGLSQSFTVLNQSTNPNNANPILLSDMYYVTTCGSALTPAIGCLVGDQEAPNTITVFPLTTPIGVAGACTGVSFTAAPTASPNEYEFTPATPVILGPSDGSGASPMCEVQFTVDVNTMPTKDALAAAGLQTAQLARATMTDTTTAETGFAAGSSTVTEYQTGDSQTIDVPINQQSFTIPSLESPIESLDPQQAVPIGVGSVAQGGDILTLKVALREFSGPVNVYFGIHAPSVDPNNIYILKSDYSLQPLSMGFEPWKGNTAESINETIYANIPISGLPSGTYYIYLAVTPTANMNTFYLWTTYFVVP